MPQNTFKNLNLPDLPEVDIEKANEFVLRWENTQGSGAELADFQSFLVELCELLGVPKPDPKSDATKDNNYIFERPVESFDASGELKNSKNRIDLYRRNCFVMEGKQTGKKLGSQGWNSAMQKAKNQADNYVRSLASDEGRPPFIVVVDVGCSIQLYSEFSCSGGIYVPFPDPGHYSIPLKEIANPDIQQRLQLLWLAPVSLDSSKYAARVTREVSEKLAKLAKSLEQTGFEVERTAHFLKRCLFTMFSEDVDLIPEGSFTALLKDLKETPKHFSDSMRALWETMNTGGFEGQLRKVLPRFNGGLFLDIDPIPLTSDQIQLLIDAAEADWRYVEPAIFGTLLERALDPRERHKLGAHYTPRAYVERLVLPTLIEPLRAEWETVKVEVEFFLQQSKETQAMTALKKFHLHLCEIKVLDPACGSANFLYVALEHLKRLEGEVLNQISGLTDGQITMDAKGLMVDPHQFLGIEINPRAAAIAEIVLWIGFLQWHYRINGSLDLPEPILKDFNNIQNSDALIEYDDREIILDDAGDPITIWDGISYRINHATGERVPDEHERTQAYNYINPRKSVWPKADFIIGNPPYLGARRIRMAVGDGYLKALRGVYAGVPENADYVMYWWHIAAEKVGIKETQRLGLITTNSLRQSFCRRVVENSLNTFSDLAIAYVVPDHPWVDSSDGAAVRVSLITAATNISDGLLSEVIKETKNGDGFSLGMKLSKGAISPNLSIGADPAGEKALVANSGISCVGYQLTGKGFVINSNQANKFSAEKYKPYIKPLLSGSDITRRPRNQLAVDLFGLSEKDLKTNFPQFHQLVLERVKPERDLNNRKALRENWWIYGEARSTFRPTLKNLENVYATSLTAKHRVFIKTDSKTICDSTTVMFAFNNVCHWGIISSRLHICWVLAAGGTLENRPRYNKGICFENFPFPEVDAHCSQRISEIIMLIDKHRKNQISQYPTLTLTNIYNVLEKLRREEPLSKNELQINQEGLVSVLRELHDNLDHEVFKAYGYQDISDILVGMPGATTPIKDKSDEQSIAEKELLIRLVELNRQRVKEELKGNVRWLRPDYQSPEAKQGGITLHEEETPKLLTKKKSLNKVTWPKELRAQINALIEVLSTAMTTQEIAKNFKHNPVVSITAVLDALEALGKVQKDGEIWFLR